LLQGITARVPVVIDPGSIVQKLAEDILLETGTRVAAGDLAELDLCLAPSAVSVLPLIVTSLK